MKIKRNKEALFPKDLFLWQPKTALRIRCNNCILTGLMRDMTVDRKSQYVHYLGTVPILYQNYLRSLKPSELKALNLDVNNYVQYINFD